MTQSPLEVHAARGWLRGFAVFALFLGVFFVALFVVTGANPFDGRFFSVLTFVVAVLSIGGSLIMWRMSGWKEWLLRIDDSGIGFRSNTALGGLRQPRHIPWDDFARAEFVTGPKATQGLELRNTEGMVGKVVLSHITVGFPQIIERLEEALAQAGVCFKRTGWDVILFDQVVIERDDTP